MIIEAALQLYAEGNLTPRVDDIAERVGITNRTIYHHYPDSEALWTAVGARQFADQLHLLARDPERGSLDERIAAVARHRAELYEAITPVRRAAVIAMHRTAVVAKQQRALNRYLRRHLAKTFEAELLSADPSTLDVLDLVASWDAWERLRARQGLSVEAARDIVAGLIARTLTP